MRSCLALLPFDQQQKAVLDWGIGFCKTAGMTMDGVLVPPAQALPPGVFDHAGLGIPHVPLRDEASDEALRSKVESAWKEACAGADCLDAFYPLEVANEDQVNALGRCADVVVAVRPGALDAPGYDATVHAALMEGGAPLLIVPPAPGAPEWKMGAVVWNGTLQSSRALRAAARLLGSFDQVTVITTGRADAAPAIKYLKRHGVAAKEHAINVKGVSARERGRRILDAAKEIGANFLVMGAYSEGRVGRYLGFGGATEKVVTGAPVPVLLSR